MKNKILRLRPSGMFSNVNEVVQQIFLADKFKYRFTIDWSKSCYRDKARKEDPWLYYFEPIWPDGYFGKIKKKIWSEAPKIEKLLGGTQVIRTKDNIITPREYDGALKVLLPRNRIVPYAIIQKHIRLNQKTSQTIQSFSEQFLEQPYIGLHIRGPGAFDGRSDALQAGQGSFAKLPLQHYFNALDAALIKTPNAKILTCSDSSYVIEKVKSRYGDQVVTYNATRSDFGEMHASHEANNGQIYDNFNLGLDVVVEAHLLAKSALLIHGTSNLTNFVLSKSPDLPHIYIEG
ncbi:MAG: hypothetical protein ABJN24_10345 [Hyphomicrobiales bacterium]